MTGRPKHNAQMERAYPVVLALLLLASFLPALLTGGDIDAVLGPAGNDDAMRLLSVQDWLAGQSWFDMTQYGVLPPEGLSLHWSRYVDLGIGSFARVLSVFLPAAEAQIWAAALWPPFLFACLLGITARGVRLLAGRAAAIVAAIFLILWLPISNGYFGPGRLDHHNAQIVLLTLATFAAVLPGHPTWRGLIAGASIALSLAIGLETVFYVVGIGFVLLFRAAFGADEDRQRLSSFAITLIICAALLHAGQTDPEQWITPYCDQLALPMLLLIAVGGIASLAMVTAARRVASPVLRLLPALTVTAVGIALAYPVLGPCLAPPYAHLPPAVQDLIASQITEALSATSFAARFPGDIDNLFGPPVAAIVIAAAITLAGARVAGLGSIFALAIVGLALSLLQVRQVVLLVPVAPFLAGWSITYLFARNTAAPNAASRLSFIGALAAIFAIPAIDDALRKAAPASAKVSHDASCRLPSTLETLNTLPTSRVLTPLNLGPKLVLSTHHSALAAPYHRSAVALTNGFVPFNADADTLRRLMQDQRADLVLVCRGSTYGDLDSVGSQLADGQVPDGFSRVDAGHPNLLLYKLMDQE